uniref:Uncharacterized protein n=1 Tax=Setaria italica TaxID=4555 RepID=K3YXM9_SETIT
MRIQCENISSIRDAVMPERRDGDQASEFAGVACRRRRPPAGGGRAVPHLQKPP